MRLRGAVSTAWAVRASAGLVLLSSAALGAHPARGGAHESAAVGSAWSTNGWDVGIAVGLLASAFVYARGVTALWRNAGRGTGVARWEAASFGMGWATLALVLVGPIDRLSDSLFSVHMVQHELLMLVAAPLVVIGRPHVAALWAMPAAWRPGPIAVIRARPVVISWRRLTGPLTVWGLHAVALWVWHLPALYEAALRSELVHAVEHACFFVTAALFWWALVYGRYGRIGYGLAVLYVFTTALHSGLLGAMFTFAPRIAYPIYALRTRAFGLDPLQDQQVAGLVMWVPAGVIFIVVGLALFAAWLGEAARRVEIAERESLPHVGAEGQP